MEDIEYTQDFYEEYLPDVVLLDSGDNSSYEKVNESVAEVGDKSNNDSPPPVHVYIP